VRRREVRVELLAYLHRFLTAEAVAGSELGDRFEVMVLSTRQAPVESRRSSVRGLVMPIEAVRPTITSFASFGVTPNDAHQLRAEPVGFMGGSGVAIFRIRTGVARWDQCE